MAAPSRGSALSAERLLSIGGASSRWTLQAAPIDATTSVSTKNRGPRFLM